MFHVIRPGVMLSSLIAIAVAATAQPLPTDPRLVTGTLDNGLRYIVRQHAYPPGRATMWIHLDTGSLNETEAQRGLAHYLEHMAFNGSENYPPGSVVPFFQSLGMTFGRDQNAFTSFEQTTYQLALPDAKTDTIDKGLTFFADVLFRLKLLPEEIEAERQIIQEERRRGLSGRQRTMFHVIERIAPGSLYGERITIGKEETINSVKQADFQDYYNKWYVASNAAVIVIADADPGAIVAAIKDKFGTAPKKPRPTPQAVNAKAYQAHFSIVASDPEVQSEDVRIVRLEPARPPTTTVPQMRDDLVMRLAEIAMNRRLSDKVATGATSYLSASVSAGNDANAIYTAEISGRAQPGKWKETLQEITLEMQRGRQFGFTARDIDDAKKQMTAAAERAVETEGTAPAQALISRINGHLAEGEPILSPQQRLELLKQILPSITASDVSLKFAAEFEPKAVCFVAVLPTSASVPSEAELTSIGIKALEAKPSKEAETERATALMDKAPTPGKVAEGTEHQNTHVWSGWLSNNIRVHHRYMDDRKNEVSVRISLIGGELLETAETRGLTQAAQTAWARAATRKLSSTDIRDLMTGKKINVGGGGGMGGRGGRRGGGGGGPSGDSITLNISGSPDELETGMQLAYLLLTEPRIEQAAFSQLQTSLREMLDESQHNPMMTGMRMAGAAPFPADEPRTRPLTKENVDQWTLDSAQNLLDRLVRESPIEVVIVGDMERDKALDLTARYLGALPSRERVAPATFAALRKLKRSDRAIRIDTAVETTTPQAFVMSGFYGADETNVADTRALGMAARILSTRMVKQVREEAQLVYSISAGLRAGSTYPGFGVFSAGAPTEPGKVAALVEKLASMYAEFAKSGPTDEELDVAKKQFANTRAEELRDPAFWARRLDQLTFRGASLDDILTDEAAMNGLTAAQVREVFAKYYSPAKSIVVTASPAGG